MTDTTRRLTPKRIDQDVQALNGLRTIENYSPIRQAAACETLQQTYRDMLQSQQQEVEMEKRLKAVRDRARQAEWAFHNAVLAMKQSVLGQFGPDSHEIQAVGYKKKAERKRSRRRKLNPAKSDPKLQIPT